VPTSLLFPDDLRQLTGGRSIVQRFGWSLRITALTLITLGGALLLGTGAPTSLELEVGGIPAAVGLLLLANEVRRRMRRLSFVALSDQIGVYRGRRLVAVAGRSGIACRGGEFTLRKLWDNMELMKLAVYSTALGVAAGMGVWVFFSISVVGRLGVNGGYSTPERALAGLMMVACAAVIVNLVLAAGYRDEIVVTTRDPAQSFTCLVARADAAELRP
jgi:hypothetical protein